MQTLQPKSIGNHPGGPVRSIPFPIFAKRTQLVDGVNATESFTGGFIKVRECYLRGDLLLPQMLQSNPGALVIVPTASTLDAHLETLFACRKAAECALILGTVVNRLKTLGYGRTLQKLRETVRLDAGRTWMGFADENFELIQSPRTTTNTLHWLAELQKQGGCSLTLVILSENDEFRAQIEKEVPDLRIMPIRTFVEEICHPAVGFCSEEEYQHALRVAESGDLVSQASKESEFGAKSIAATKDTPSSTTTANSDMMVGSSGPRLRGKLKCTGARIAFVGSNAIIPSPDHRNRAIHGDLVEIEPLRGPSSLHQEATTDDDEVDVSGGQFVPYRVVSVLKSAEKRRNLVVTLDVKEAERLGSSSSISSGNETRRLLCVPMDDRYPKVRVQTRLGPMLVGKRFIVSIADWPEDSMWPNARYLRTLGNALDLKTESSAILVETELEAHEKPFPPAAMAEVPASDSEYNIALTGKELDFRDRRVMSIDPIGCQDIDDAISLERLPDGSLELCVHIADVARFVQSGTALDREANSRATSVYLQERRLDMLPGVLCENLASLRPRLDRYAVSAIFRVDPITMEADVHSARFERTLIHSRYALAYEQAQRLADGLEPRECMRGGWTGGKVDPGDFEWMREVIRDLMRIARNRERERKARGAVTLESADAEFKFALDAASRPVDVSGSHHMEIHDTIAELMILANEAAARLMLKKVPTRALLRHHPPADPTRFKQCIEFAQGLGFPFDATSNKTVAASLKHIRDKADKATAQLIENLATRAMSEAQYVCAGAVTSTSPSESPFFHFGLGLDHYTHFTSPIRRYADLVVARLLLEDEGDDVNRGPRDAAVVAAPVVVDVVGQQVQAKEPPPPILFEDPKATEDDFSWANALGKGGSDDDDDDADDDVHHKSDGTGFDDLLGWVTGGAQPSQQVSPSMSTVWTAQPATDEPNKAGSLDAVLEYASEAPKPSEPSVVSASRTTGNTHATTQSVQETCEHINFRHRSAKEASSRSQQLFFSLYFADRPLTSVTGVVYSIRSDGCSCFVPDFDLRIPIRLVGSNGQVIRKSFYGVEDVNNNIKVMTSKDSISVYGLQPSAAGSCWTIRVMDRVKLVVSCDLSVSNEVPPGPRVPEISGALCVTVVEEANSSTHPTGGGRGGRDLLRKTVMSDSAEATRPSDGDEENIRERINTRRSLYTASTKLAHSSSAQVRDTQTPGNKGTHPAFDSSHIAPAKRASIFTGKTCFGGFVPKPIKVAGIKHYLEDEEDEDDDRDGAGRDTSSSSRSRSYVPRVSASSMSNAQMKKLEKEAMARVAKLQAEKFDSRVKRRMKKG